MAKDKTKLKAKVTAKADKPAKAAKKAAAIFDLTGKELAVAFIKATVTRDGDILNVDWRRPRRQLRENTVIPIKSVHAWCEATEDEGGYIMTDHPSFASYIFTEVVTEPTVEDGFLVATNGNGNRIGVNLSKITPEATARAAE